MAKPRLPAMEIPMEVELREALQAQAVMKLVEGRPQLPLMLPAGLGEPFKHQTAKLPEVLRLGM